MIQNYNQPRKLAPYSIKGYMMCEQQQQYCCILNFKMFDSQCELGLKVVRSFEVEDVPGTA